VIERKYFHYSELEEWRDGMWRIVGGEKKRNNMNAAADLMRDSDAFEAAMMRALEEWPNSCAHNLSAEDTNRLAWLGHAGCLLAAGSPEENTRCGWHTLTLAEQDAANAAAQKVLDMWVAANSEAPALLKIMGI
jgi:glutaminase